MKLLVLILGARSGEYQEIIKNSLITWGTLKNDNIVVYNYYGNHDKNEIINNELLLATNDKNITYKTLLAFQYALQHFEFDYLIRPNASTYVRLDKLYEHLLSAPRQNYYAGNKQTINFVTYVSGTHMIYSRDIVENILKNIDISFEPQWTDDWVIGKYLEKNKIYITEDIKHYLLINNWPETELLNKMYNLSKKDIDDYIFFRCKTEVPITQQEYKRNDIIKMNYLHKILYA